MCASAWLSPEQIITRLKLPMPANYLRWPTWAYPSLLTMPRYQPVYRWRNTGFKPAGAIFYQQQNCGQKTGKNAGGIASCLSPWLALGCVSPRQVYWEVVKHRSTLQNADALMLELLWRDYFRFMFKKHGQNISAPKVLARRHPKQQQTRTNFLSIGKPAKPACLL
jgi:hypothetical protein